MAARACWQRGDFLESGPPPMRAGVLCGRHRRGSPNVPSLNRHLPVPDGASKRSTQARASIEKASSTPHPASAARHGVQEQGCLRLLQGGPASDGEDAALIALSVKCNCHKSLAVDPVTGGDVGGVCRLASRFAHSCQPNLVCYTAKSGDRLSFVALRDIAAGEVLSFSYRGETGFWLLQPSRRRQEDLRRCFYFRCACDRCAGPDRPRRFRCAACSGAT
eukprot:gene18207-40024_t